MKLLHVISSTESESGGPIEAVQRITEVLLRDGHDIQVLSLESGKEIASRHFHFPLLGLGPSIGRFRYTSSLKPWMRRNAERFDAIILHGLWNYVSVGAWLGIRKTRTPYFIFTHGMMDPWFREHYPLKHIKKQIYWTLLQGRALHDARRVLFTCEEEMLRARNVFYGHPYREQVVLYGTADPEKERVADSAAFLNAFPVLRDRRFLLFISRIHPKKGCDLLIQAFGDCMAQLPTDLDLVMAGPDQAGWVPRLKAIAAERGIANRVHWTGMLKGDLKWGAFRAAEAMILPSHQENFGFVVAESMACSTPVLTSDKVNIWREVVASKAGLAAPDTLEGTRDLILRFCALSADDRAQMASNARAGFLRHFDIEVTAREFARMIERLKDEPLNASQETQPNGVESH